MAAFKAQAMIKRLKESLQLSEPGISFVEGNDSSFYPILLCAKGTAGAREAILIKIETLPDPAAHVDALGSAQRLYNPHKVTILREDAAGMETPQQPELRERVTAECVKLGSRVIICEKEGIRTATAVSSYDLSGSTQVADLTQDLTKANPLTNSQ